MTPAEQANLPRARGQAGPHYEVWFIEVQDTARKTGLWLRYTLRIPAHGGAVAQVWATYYDRADPARSFGLVRTAPLSELHLGQERFLFALGDARLDQYGCRGLLDDGTHKLKWDLSWAEDMLVEHFPLRAMYEGPLPRTKLVAPHFALSASGQYMADGQAHLLSECPGVQSHIWGTSHAPRWRWCRAHTFWEDPSAAFEALTADVRVGPATVPLTLFVLRTQGRLYRFHQPLALISGNESHTDAVEDADPRVARVGRWTVGGGDTSLRFRGEISAPLPTFLGLEYADPDGSARYCAHSKLATVSLELLEPEGRGRWRVAQTLRSDESAALEFVGGAPDRRVRSAW